MFASKNLTTGQLNAVVKRLGGEEGALKLLRDELVVSEAKAKKLLKRLPTTIAVPTMTQFIAADNFIADTSEKAKVKISGLGSAFKTNYLLKIEENKVATEGLAINKLLEYAHDPAIITFLGGEPNVEISLGQFFAAFAKQPNGEKGDLLTNGYANVGYIRDINGVLWSVYGRWVYDGWIFGVHSLGSSRRWHDGVQFLSH